MISQYIASYILLKFIAEPYIPVSIHRCVFSYNIELLYDYMRSLEGGNFMASLQNFKHELFVFAE